MATRPFDEAEGNFVPSGALNGFYFQQIESRPEELAL